MNTTIPSMRDSFAGDDGTIEVPEFTVAARAGPRSAWPAWRTARSARSSSRRHQAATSSWRAQSLGHELQGQHRRWGQGLSTKLDLAKARRGCELFDNFFSASSTRGPTTIPCVANRPGEVITKHTRSPPRSVHALRERDPRAGWPGLQHDHHRGRGRRRRAAMYWRLIGSPDPSWVAAPPASAPSRRDHVGVRRRGGRAELRVVLPAARPNPMPITVPARFLPETGMPTWRTSRLRRGQVRPSH